MENFALKLADKNNTLNYLVFVNTSLAFQLHSSNSYASLHPPLQERDYSLSDIGESLRGLRSLL